MRAASSRPDVKYGAKGGAARDGTAQVGATDPHGTGSPALTVLTGHCCRASCAGYRYRMAGHRRKEPIARITHGSACRNFKAKLAVSCPKCHHKAVVEVDQWPPDMPTFLFGSIMECSKCGTIGANVRPVCKVRAIRPAGRRTGPGAAVHRRAAEK
jgi:hypothetical protein